MHKNTGAEGPVSADALDAAAAEDKWRQLTTIKDKSIVNAYLLELRYPSD